MPYVLPGLCAGRVNNLANPTFTPRRNPECWTVTFMRCLRSETLMPPILQQTSASSYLKNTNIETAGRLRTWDVLHADVPDLPSADQHDPRCCRPMLLFQASHTTV